METQGMIDFNQCVLLDQQREFEELVECGICSDQLVGSPAMKLCPQMSIKMVRLLTGSVLRG